MSLNYKMIPGSREKDTEGTFRDTPGVSYMTATNMGHATAATNMGHATAPANSGHPGGRKEGESREDYGKRVYKEAMERQRKREESRQSGNNQNQGRSGDFKFGPIRGNLNRYGEGG